MDSTLYFAMVYLLFDNFFSATWCAEEVCFINLILFQLDFSVKKGKHGERIYYVFHKLYSNICTITCFTMFQRDLQCVWVGNGQFAAAHA